MTTLDVDTLAREQLAKHGVQAAFLGYDGFPAAICISVNEEIVHGIPGERVIREGDLVKYDFGVELELAEVAPRAEGAEGTTVRRVQLRAGVEAPLRFPAASIALSVMA
jgi:methionine aminopeptidase